MRNRNNIEESTLEERNNKALSKVDARTLAIKEATLCGYEDSLILF